MRTFEYQVLERTSKVSVIGCDGVIVFGFGFSVRAGIVLVLEKDSSMNLIWNACIIVMREVDCIRFPFEANGLPCVHERLQRDLAEAAGEGPRIRSVQGDGLRAVLQIHHLLRGVRVHREVHQVVVRGGEGDCVRVGAGVLAHQIALDGDRLLQYMHLYQTVCMITVSHKQHVSASWHRNFQLVVPAGSRIHRRS